MDAFDPIENKIDLSQEFKDARKEMNNVARRAKYRVKRLFGGTKRTTTRKNSKKKGISKNASRFETSRQESEPSN